MCPGTSSEIKDADLHQCVLCEPEGIPSEGCMLISLVPAVIADPLPLTDEYSCGHPLSDAQCFRQVLTCLLASTSHCLSSLTKLLPIPGHFLAKTVFQIFPVAVEILPSTFIAQFLHVDTFQTLVTCILLLLFCHSQSAGTITALIYFLSEASAP